MLMPIPLPLLMNGQSSDIPMPLGIIMLTISLIALIVTIIMLINSFRD